MKTLIVSLEYLGQCKDFDISYPENLCKFELDEYFEEIESYLISNGIDNCLSPFNDYTIISIIDACYNQYSYTVIPINDYDDLTVDIKYE